ncbi:hypothetical protein C8255_14260 [filamentous cyanobacterium CCP3]|nr:hypothetical protein C8255_14260 [filamentous cyanobacterium CCP3]
MGCLTKPNSVVALTRTKANFPSQPIVWLRPWVQSLLLLGALAMPAQTQPQACTEATIERHLNAMVQWTEREAALEAIQRCGVEAIPGLVTALNWGDRDISLEAIAALETLLAFPDARSWADRWTPLIAALTDLLATHGDGQVRSASAAVLGSLARTVDNATQHRAIAPALINALSDTDPVVQINTAYALGQVRQGGDTVTQALQSALAPAAANPDLQAAIARALAHLSVTAPLVELLQDSTAEDTVKIAVSRGLRAVTKPTQPVVDALVNTMQSTQVELAIESSSALHTIAQNNPEQTGILLLPHLKVLTTNLENPHPTVLANTVGLLGVASDRIPQANLPRAERVAQTQTLRQGLDKLKANPGTSAALEQDLDRAIRSTQAGNPAVERVMAEAVRIGGTTLLIHSLFWLALVAIYPTSPQVQAIFFWNPRVRKLFGLGYVELALTWVPWLRAKLFAPFRANLLAEVDLGKGIEPVYFAGSDVVRRGDSQRRPLVEAIPEVKGQVVLEGESGLGKTMTLKQMVQRSRRLVVYLPARRCAGGVIEAIRDRLHGPIQDGDFLQSLIYSGAIDICIDGLNEVTPDTRAKVSLFAETYFKGNLVITTQPMDWEPPNNATVYVLQPLTSDQIGAFLLSRSSTLPVTAPVTGAQYEQACRAFLDQLQPDQLGREVMAHTLSNPMELTVVAQMLADGKQPDLLNLQQQQYNAMASRYQYINMHQPFPLAAFAEMAYEMRQTDASIIPAESWFKELNCMEDYRMVLSRQLDNAKGGTTTEWRFRHEKIQDFFIVQTFWGQDNERPAMHLGDPRFRGVYFLLATELPLAQAMQLRELLITHAVKTKDHTVSDRFIELLQTRSAAEP